jgi:ribosomal protein S19
MNLLVHKGFLYKKVQINEFLVGHKLGEFSVTRKPFKYPIKKKKKNFLRR